MVTEIPVRVPDHTSSSRMFKGALRSEVELELATARNKIMSIQRDIDSCERVVLWKDEDLFMYSPELQ